MTGLTTDQAQWPAPVQVYVPPQKIISALLDAAEADGFGRSYVWAVGYLATVVASHPDVVERLMECLAENVT